MPHYQHNPSSLDVVRELNASDPCPVCEDETSWGEPCDACWSDRISA